SHAQPPLQPQYEPNKTTNNIGYVTKIDWVNPHAFVFIDTKDEHGEVKNFKVEMGPPYARVRGGWKRDTLKMGKKSTEKGPRSRVTAATLLARCRRRRWCCRRARSWSCDSLEGGRGRKGWKGWKGAPDGKMGPSASRERRHVPQVKKIAGTLLLACAMATPASAQATPPAVSPAEPTPRWPDGHVNLGSTPDKKGYWEVRPGLGGFPRATDVPLQPWARALYEYRTPPTD